jgi:hypothetical protein
VSCRLHHAEVLLASAGGVKATAILKVLFEGGNDLVRREAQSINV